MAVVRYGSGIVDTVGTKSRSPYEFFWDCSDVTDQDQIHLQFGYTLFADSLHTIVSPPLPHRWMLMRETRKSRKVVHVHQITRPDTICVDGNLDDWKRIRKTRLGNTGYARMCWTIGKVYFAGFIKDTTVCPADYLELHFDMYNDKSDFAGKNHRSIRFGPRSRALCFTVELNDSGFTPADSVTLLIKEQMEWRAVVNEDGYFIEAAIPFFALSDLMYPSMKSGFDLTVVDVTNNSDTVFYSWGGNKDLYCRYTPSRWGTLRLHQAMVSIHFFMLFGAAFFVVLICSIIAWLLYRHYTDRKIDDGEEKKYSETMMEIVTCIKENLSDPNLSSSIIAELISRDRESVEQTVKIEADCSLEYLILKERINCSKKLLSSETYLVEEIVKTAGFRDYETFVSAFADATRTTPEKYYERKRIDALEEHN
jgi:AraC-like DNA-binding protein